MAGSRTSGARPDLARGRRLAFGRPFRVKKRMEEPTADLNKSRRLRREARTRLVCSGQRLSSRLAGRAGVAQA